MKVNELKVGDVLIQKKGEPWTTFVWIGIGSKYCHARVVCDILSNGDIYTYESVYPCVSKTKLNPNDFGNYEVWEPKCDEETINKALTWISGRLGKPYGYFNAFTAFAKYRFGLNIKAGLDEDDNRPMICSELIAMGFYRAGYDLVPNVVDMETMPFHLRNPERLRQKS